MGKVVIKEINRFFGGISDDVREPASHKFAASKHFDIFSNPYRLVPYRTTEEAETKSFDIVSFLVAENTLYGLGVDTGSIPKIYELNSIESPSPSWSASTNGAASSGSRAPAFFMEYKDYLYGLLSSGTHLWRWGDLTGSPTFSQTYKTLGETISSTCQGVIGPDDKLYIPYNNHLSCLDSAGTLSDQILSVPSKYKISSITEWKDFIAIGIRPKAARGKSFVYLYDPVTTNLEDVIDFGNGELEVLGNMNNHLIVGMNLTTDAFDDRILIKTYSGSLVETQKEVPMKDESGNVHRIFQGNNGLNKFEDGNKLYFLVDGIGIAGDFVGVWAVGQKNVSYPLAIVHDQRIGQDESITDVNGFYKAGDYFFIAHSNDGSVDRTNDASVHLASSVYETQIFDEGEKGVDKKLLWVEVGYDPIPSGASVGLDYRVNHNSSYEDIFDESTQNAISTKATNETADNNDEFKRYKQIQFRLISTGGSEITTFRYAYEILESKN